MIDTTNNHNNITTTSFENNFNMKNTDCRKRRPSDSSTTEATQEAKRARWSFEEEDRQRQQQEQKRRRRVHFGYQHIKVFVKDYDSSDRYNIWYSPEEMQGFFRREMMAGSVSSKNSEGQSYMHNLIQLLVQCIQNNVEVEKSILLSRKNRNNSTSDNDDNNDNEQQQPQQQRYTDEIKSLWTLRNGSDLRGLEKDFVSVFRKRRMFVVRTVLETQAQLSDAHLNVRNHWVAERYHELSHAGALFAQAIAEGDAEAAL